MILTLSTTHSKVYDWLYDILLNLGFSDQLTHTINALILLILLVMVLYALDYLSRRIFLISVMGLIKKSKTLFDDYLLKHRVLKYFTHIISIIIIRLFIPLIFIGFPKWINTTLQIADVVLVLIIGILLNSVTKAVRDFLKTKKAFEDKPLDSYAQVVGIFIFFVCGIIIFTTLTGKSPYAFLISLGAASAILMLIFKDTILGFVASVQVSANDMVRVGDWVEMPKYGADGAVLSINLNTVKVQNWDKTITTVPTYAFISDSFKNWRGMQESGGRRIKRAIYLKMSSFKFLNQEDLEKFKKYRLIKDYILEKEIEIKEYNKAIDAEFLPANTRRLSNVGVFRIYANKYLRENQGVNQNMTIMVRQLAPTPHGLPMEIYCFSKDIRWVYYEGIVADIFDHLLTIVKEFDLEIFEEPSGADFSGSFSK